MKAANKTLLTTLCLVALSMPMRGMADVDQSPSVDLPAAQSVTVDIDVVVAPVADIDGFGILYSFPGDSEPGSWRNDQVGDITPHHPRDYDIQFASGPLVAKMRDGLVSQSRLVTHGSLSLIDRRESEFTPEFLRVPTQPQIRLGLNGHVDGDSIDLHVTVTGAYDRIPHQLGTRVPIRRGLSREVHSGDSLVIGGILTKDGRYVLEGKNDLWWTYFGRSIVDHVKVRNKTLQSEELMVFVTPHVDSPHHI